AVLEKNEDYIVEYENDTRIGNAKLHIVAVEGNAKYTGSITKTYKIVKGDLVALVNNGDIKISTVTGGNYSGKEIKPNVTIKYGMYTLIKEKDYTVTYKNNKNVTRDQNNNVVKNAEVIIKGKGSFTGELSVNNTALSEKLKFMVSPQYLNRDAVKAKSKTLVYTGKPLKYSVTVTSDISGVLKQGRDYKISKYTFVPSEAGKETVSAAVTDNKVSIIDKGTYTLTLEGTGNYAGSTTVDVKVTDQLHNIANAKVEVKATDFTGNAVELVPYSESTANSYGIKISDKSGKVLTQDDYELEYENNTNAGNSASVTVIGKGEYAGTKTVKFKINKADIKENLKENGLTLKEVEGKVPEFFYYTGYALKPDYVVAVKLEKEEKYQKKSSKEITLVAGRDYTITYSNNVTGKKQKSQTSYLANVTIKGKGNYTGTLKAVFEIKPTDLDDFIVRVDKAEYTGKAVKPVITFTHKVTKKNFTLKDGTAYKVSYKYNKNVANENSKKAPTVTITSKGLGYGNENRKAKSITKQFCITNAKIDASSVADIKVQSYKNGKAVKPVFVVKVNGKVLKKNKDYKITYINNRLRGRATATITGIGNYTGTVKKEFVIK
ncbi:MAG: hypothetical protein II193_02630, partial [Lachnospiraceae bacterium]|nr:hypothetical protein [Lachnospiraceae bacterium]